MECRSILCLFLTLLILFFSAPFLISPRTAEAQTDQDLGLKLVGTAVTDEAGQSFAIIEVISTRNQRAFREGDRWGEILIRRVLPLSVVIDTGKGEVILSLASGAKRAGPSMAPEMAHVDRKEVDSTLPDESQLTQEIRVRPRFEGGQPIGFVIYKIEPGSIFERMGLRDGDIIVGVNGKPFATTQQTLEFYDALKQGGTVSLEVMRGERKRNLDFVIQ